MGLISYLMQRRNYKQKSQEVPTKVETSPEPTTNTPTQKTLTTDSMLHLSYPFYLLGRAPH